jgi:tRNA A-37 threonylcarbamoyl transferase component Bud32
MSSEGDGATAVPIFPDLVVDERLGQGGMGTVFRARQQSLERVVAVKTIRDELLGDARVRERFLREAKYLAQLDHPNVVPVYLAAEHEGRPYYVMRLIGGRSIGEAFERGDWKGIAQAFRKVAQAVEVAHRAGILHRDIKPQNILVDQRREPILVDFGLAGSVRVTDASLATSPQILGTPDYLPPEIASGESHSAASDIYSLGATLYRVLTGRPPFPGTNLLEKLRDILEANPELPRKSRPDVPEDLQSICLQAMDRTPAKRYVSAHALAEDLRRFLQGERVHARPSLYRSLLERRVEEHAESVDRWVEEGLVTPRDRDELREVYERLFEGERDSIFELSRFSAALAFLYIGALIAVLGPAMLLVFSWNSLDLGGRLLLTTATFAVLAIPGTLLWRRGDFRLGIPFLLGAATLVPMATYIGVDEVPDWREIVDPKTLDVRPIDLKQFDFVAAARTGIDGLIQRTLDRKLLVCCASALASGIFLRRITRSPAFLWFSIVTGLALYYLAAATLGWRHLGEAWRWAVMLPAGALCLGIGIVPDLRDERRDARPFYILGFAALVAAWVNWANAHYPAAAMLALSERELTQLSFAAGGVLALGLAMLADRIATPLLLRYSPFAYLVACAGVLLSLSVLVDRAGSHAEYRVYEIALPIVCLAFVLLSIVLQRKRLLYSGGGYLAVATYQITHNHFEGKWQWSVALVAAGLAIIALGYGLPLVARRWKHPPPADDAG